MRFGEGLAFTFRAISAFIRKAWWLVPVPVLPGLIFNLTVIHEVLQREVPAETILFFQMVEQIFVVAPTYWVMRFLTLDGSAAAAISINRQSALSFAPYLAIMSIFWIGIDISANAGILAVFPLALIGVGIECILAPWSVMAPSGSRAIGPIKSAKAALPMLPWAFGFLTVATTLPTIPLMFLLFFKVGTANTGWQQTFYELAYSLTIAIDLLVLNVAVFVIASRMGLRISRPEGLARIFD